MNFYDELLHIEHIKALSEKGRNERKEIESFRRVKETIRKKDVRRIKDKIKRRINGINEIKI